MVRLNKLASIFIISIIMLSGLIPLINAPVLPGTYYGNFTHATEITSIGIVRKWIVYNETSLVLYNDNFTYWTNAIGINKSDDVLTVYNGTHSTKLDVILASNFLQRHNIPSLDISAYTNLVFYLHELNTGHTSTITLFGNGGTFVNVIDNSTGWTKIDIPFTKFGGVFTAITYIEFENFNNGSIYYIDSLYLYRNSPTYYQIWDGATLKYQSTIEPDIFDFVQQPTLIDSTINVPGIISISEVDNPVITFDAWLIILFIGLILSILATQIRIHILALAPMVMTLWGIINWNMYPTIILLNCIIWVLTLLFSIVAISEV